MITQDSLLQYFVANCSALYGRIMVVYNVHCLLHLADDVERFNCPLDKISAFSFENYMCSLKKYVRSPQNPIAQVAKRVGEYERVTIQEFFHGLQATWKFSNSSRDNCYLLNSGWYVFIREVRTLDKKTCLVCDACSPGDTSDYFSEPCSSSWLRIAYLSSKVILKRKLITEEEISCKCLNFPVASGGSVIVPIIHE